jgi:hypothetical protein
VCGNQGELKSQEEPTTAAAGVAVGLTPARPHHSVADAISPDSTASTISFRTYFVNTISNHMTGVFGVFGVCVQGEIEAEPYLPESDTHREHRLAFDACRLLSSRHTAAAAVDHSPGFVDCLLDALCSAAQASTGQVTLITPF